VSKENWQDTLKPFDDIFEGIENRLTEMSDEELEALFEACRHPTTTNCWWLTLNGAVYLLPRVVDHMRERNWDQKIAEKQALQSLAQDLKIALR
jgi:hypothetical protein